MQPSNNNSNRPLYPQQNPNNCSYNLNNFPRPGFLTEEERRRLNNMQQNSPLFKRRGFCNRTCY